MKTLIPALIVAFSLAGAAQTIAFTGDVPPPAPSGHASEHTRPTVGVGVKMSTLGIGFEAAVPVTRMMNLRAGFNTLDVSHGFSNDGIHYNGALRFRSVETLVDIFPFGGNLHISPGMLIYNGNQVRANASVPGGQTFTLGGATFMSDPADPIVGTGLINLNKAAPMVRWGFGNLAPRHSHFHFGIEGGMVFQGSPKTILNLAGSACDPVTGLLCHNAATDPNIQAQVQAQQNKINSKLTLLKFYPAFSIGFGYKF